MLRHVTDTTATIWVETDEPCRVSVAAGEHRAVAETFTVHGHHYAVCEFTGLRPGSALPYEVRLERNGEEATVWPEPGSGYPPSLVRTLDHTAPVRILFGSCRMTTDHSPEAVLRNGVDMLRAQSLRLADRRGDGRLDGTAGDAEPTLLLLIGDQVYADELQPGMKRFLRENRARAEAKGEAHPPEDEVVFFDEYAELYRRAWSDPDVRWLLSTVPTLMLFDDHDIRDDWNTSGTWRRQIAENPWWGPRITSGLGAYWVYQHLGNLSSEQRAADPVFGKVAAQEDGSDVLDAFAQRADEDPVSYRWSHRHDVGGTRLLLVDTRCGRVVEDDRRRGILDSVESAWLDEQLTGDVDHLVVASTLPFLLPRGVHYLEAWNEAVCAGKWGRALRRPSETLRQAIDLEHWSAFQDSFHAVADAVVQVAAGGRGAPPASVLFLGGDVHFSYLAGAHPRGGAARASHTRIAQLVCSPVRNQLPSLVGKLTRVAAWRITGAAGALLARMAGVRRPGLSWELDAGPWYGNTLATLTIEGRRAEVGWEHAPVSADAMETPEQDSAFRPELRELARERITD
uniref:alkaline phosphatase D family protein n=1 Tax=Allosalinactinospora lopnorensis TaxID=1352348 RepID=UPI000623F383|nr:alkaline phosphatase D family protein [Allosalinactinospora lopnorensis]